MHSIKTSGIVLKGTNFGEADKILTVFTDRLGKIKVMAKGVRKTKSHLAGSLEPFIYSELLLHEGKTFYTISGASILKSYPRIHDEMKKISQAFFLGELIDCFAPEKEKPHEMFTLFLSALDSLESDAKDLFMTGFQLKIIEEAGFEPELYSCVHCKEKITVENNFWDATEGGLICNNCQGKFHHGREISDDAIKLLRFFEQNDFVKIERLKVDEVVVTEVEKILRAYICSVLEKELKSENFMKYCCT